MTAMTDDIPELIDRFREAEQSDKNRRNREVWSGWPASLDGPQPFPITIEPEAPLWGDILGFGLVAYFTDPQEYLRRNLQMSLVRFERWDENTPLEKRIRIWMGVSLESSLFGAETRYGERDCPWIARPHVIREREDFDRLSNPDFRTAGLMPRAHEFYERIRELLPDDFEVDFPDWERSPFGVCMHLRGTEDLLVDMMQDSDFAAEQIAFMTECRKRWVGERARFLGREVEPGVLLNDEVNGEIFPPRMYEQFVLASEVELAEFQKITYWHSCGDTTAFLRLIHRIPGLEVFHVGPRTDVAAAAEQMEGAALQVCLDPVQDVQRADAERVRGRIRTIAEACGDKPFTVRADGLHCIDTLEPELERIDRWLELARGVREEFARV